MLDLVILLKLMISIFGLAHYMQQTKGEDYFLMIS